jgi:hypothetical protein
VKALAATQPITMNLCCQAQCSASVSAPLAVPETMTVSSGVRRCTKWASE